MPFTRLIEIVRERMSAYEKARELEMNSLAREKKLTEDYQFVGFEKFGGDLVAYYKSRVDGEYKILFPDINKKEKA